VRLTAFAPDPQVREGVQSVETARLGLAGSAPGGGAGETHGIMLLRDPSVSVDLAKKLGSSQSRLAKMEAGSWPGQLQWLPWPWVGSFRSSALAFGDSNTREESISLIATDGQTMR
jgi:hypothetical protein